MKPGTFFSAILISVIFLFVSHPLSATPAGKGKIEIVITSHTTRAQLDSMETALAAQGVTLDVDMAIFSKAGQLERISGKVTFSAKQFGTFSSDNVGTITITKKGGAMKINVQDPVQQ
ncbi:MAG: hypothetical protein HY064_04420 [Bacteroidetes bacterium]|nr:hypothetical protein [Bacteroidota bacterium]